MTYVAIFVLGMGCDALGSILFAYWRSRNPKRPVVDQRSYFEPCGKGCEILR